MKKPYLLTPEKANTSGVTYEQLIEEGLTFLAHCGQLTMIEQAKDGTTRPLISVNECLGMGTRVIAEASLQIQAVADEAEL